MQSLYRLHNCNFSFFFILQAQMLLLWLWRQTNPKSHRPQLRCSCHPNEILKIRSLELNATSGKQGFRTKDMHVISAEILNRHNKILIDNIASELIVIENARPPSWNDHSFSCTRQWVQVKNKSGINEIKGNRDILKIHGVHPVWSSLPAVTREVK